MFRKPTCPYCKAIYTSDEIKKQYNNEKIKCHNCKKIFVVKKNGGLVLLTDNGNSTGYFDKYFYDVRNWCKKCYSYVYCDNNNNSYCTFNEVIFR